MTETPWGNSATLRERQLPPGPGTSRHEVDLNQRERLYAATVAVTTRKGYADTSVTDIVELAGISSSSFYRHFADKEACFLATQAEILAQAQAAIAAQLVAPGSWQERLRRAADAVVSHLVEQPAAARLCLVESYAAGPAAMAPLDDAVEAAVSALRRSPEGDGRTPMPRQVVKAIATGFIKIGHTYLHRGRERELVDHSPRLLELALAYKPPPGPLRARRPQRPAPSEDGRRPLDPRADPAERIVAATMRVVAEKGYRATTMADIAHAAAVSLSTLYAHFDGKADAFDAALYGGRARLLGATLPVHRRARNWAEGLCATVRATLSFLEAEPEFTRLISVDVYSAGGEALERRDRAIEGVQRLIEEGVEKHAPQMQPVWCEAIANFLYVLLCERVWKHGVSELWRIEPHAVYLAVAPFLGAEEAARLANGGRGTKAPPARREAGEPA